MVGIPRAKRFNEIVAMDVGELEGRKFLMFVDMDTCYVKETLIRIKRPKIIVKKLLEKWMWMDIGGEVDLKRNEPNELEFTRQRN